MKICETIVEGEHNGAVGQRATIRQRRRRVGECNRAEPGVPQVGQLCSEGGGRDRQPVRVSGRPATSWYMRMGTAGRSRTGPGSASPFTVTVP